NDPQVPSRTSERGSSMSVKRILTKQRDGKQCPCRPNTCSILYRGSSIPPSQDLGDVLSRSGARGTAWPPGNGACHSRQGNLRLTPSPVITEQACSGRFTPSGSNFLRQAMSRPEVLADTGALALHPGR